MVTKFEETGSLNVRSERRRNPVSAEAIEKVALQVEEDKASYVQASTSVRRVACDESARNLSTNLLRRLFGEYKFAFISNQLQKDERDMQIR
ncbi:hypothetical protein TNCV_2367901 [Trichonephila clavipes]|nr:hypothetical protein TNCV_2367901 [Trichonephila clavipes]